MKRIMIAGTKSGVGKTTLVMGLLAALSRKINIQPFKVGPDYIDGAFHTAITGNICRNLDSFLLEDEMILKLFMKNCKGRELAVTEGVMGLFDGAEVGSDRGTSASIAKIVKMPVILVVDGSKVAASVAAVIKGFELFDPELKMGGVIINNVSGEAHYELLKEAVEYHTGVTPCGYLKKNTDLSLPERHLGLVPACEREELQKTFDALADAVEESVDLDKILKIAESAPELPPLREPELLSLREPELLSLREKKREGKSLPPLRVGLARDKAFNFYYQDSLDLLSEKYNVTWVPFSPLSDSSLPENLQGLYIGGGFPEIFGRELSENRAFIKSLIKELDRGIPCIAECGGLMYLCETITDLKGETHPVAGWFQGYSVMTNRLQRFGYGHLTLDKECLLGKKGESIKIHEFHRSQAEIHEEEVYLLKKIRKGEVVKTWKCGYRKKGVTGAYAHFHFCSNTSMAASFVSHMREYQRESRGAQWDKKER